jgi:hypothetical protein
MSKLHITEFSGVGNLREDGNANHGAGAVPAARGSLAYQSITLSGSSQPSSAFNASTHIIQVSADAEAFICIAPAPNATSGIKIHVPANQVMYFSVSPGEKIDGILAS